MNARFFGAALTAAAFASCGQEEVATETEVVAKATARFEELGGVDPKDPRCIYDQKRDGEKVWGCSITESEKGFLLIQYSPDGEKVVSEKFNP